MNIELIDFASVNPAAYNPRVRLTQNDPEYQSIKASLDEFGLVQPLVFNRKTKNLVGGHQRMWIMQDCGRTQAHMVVVDLPLEKEKRLNVALNGITGKWDRPMLGTVLAELQAAQQNIHNLGFTTVDLNALLKQGRPKPKRDPNQAPAKPLNPITKPGDIYTLAVNGATHHRLQCGDSSQAEAVANLCDGHRARMIFTDPPYGVTYDNSQRGDGRRSLGAVMNDELRGQSLTDFLTRVFTAAFAVSREDAALYTFHASVTVGAFKTALEASGWREKQALVWRKHFALSRSDYHWAHEPFLYFAKAGQDCHWFGPRTETTILDTAEEEFDKLSKDEMKAVLKGLREALTVWDVARDTGANYVHPTQKPVELACRAIRNSTMPAEVVVDLFGGSGSTMIAAEMEGRAAFLQELDPGYCDVIVRRFLETFEGATATRNTEPYALA